MNTHTHKQQAKRLGNHQLADVVVAVVFAKTRKTINL